MASRQTDQRRYLAISPSELETIYSDLSWDSPPPSRYPGQYGNYSVPSPADAASEYQNPYGYDDDYGSEQNLQDAYYSPVQQPLPQRQPSTTVRRYVQATGEYIPISETPGGETSRYQHSPFQQMQRMQHSRRTLFGRDYTDVDQKFAHVPPQYKYIPIFVLVARRIDLDLFWDIMDDFFEHGTWFPFLDLPVEFLEKCSSIGVGPDDLEYRPGFAPKWLFELKKIDDTWYEVVVDYFFKKQEIVPWNFLPPQIVEVFVAKNIGEFDYS